MLEFQIKAEIYHLCNTQSTFDQISKFFKLTSPLKIIRKIAHSDFITYDQEFQFITYNLQRNWHMSLKELFVYLDQQDFKNLIYQSIEILKEQDNIFKQEKLEQYLSIQSLDSSKIWFEFDQKKIIDVYILNFVSFAKNGKTISDIMNYFNYLIEIKPDANQNQKIIKKTQKQYVQKINKDYESAKQQSYPIFALEINNLNKAVNSFYLGILDEYIKIEQRQSSLQSIVIQSKKYFTKIINYLKKIEDKLYPQNLLNELSDIIKNENGCEEKLELLIIKLIQKYNLFDEFFSKNYENNIQINKFIKQYLREKIYQCLLNENQKIIPYNKIMIYLTILNFKKSTADLEKEIKLMFQYTHERLAIFKYQWSGKIISDQEVLEQFLIAQTKILQSKKYKIINKNLFIQTIMQSQIYKERVLYLERGFDILKQHFQVEFITLAKDYFHQYQFYLMKDQNILVNVDEIINTLFLDMVNLQLQTIINTVNVQKTN